MRRETAAKPIAEMGEAELATCAAGLGLRAAEAFAAQWKRGYARMAFSHLMFER